MARQKVIDCSAYESLMAEALRAYEIDVSYAVAISRKATKILTLRANYAARMNGTLVTCIVESCRRVPNTPEGKLCRPHLVESRRSLSDKLEHDSYTDTIAESSS